MNSSLHTDFLPAVVSVSEQQATENTYNETEITRQQHITSQHMSSGLNQDGQQQVLQKSVACINAQSDQAPGASIINLQQQHQQHHRQQQHKKNLTVASISLPSARGLSSLESDSTISDHDKQQKSRITFSRLPITTMTDKEANTSKTTEESQSTDDPDSHKLEKAEYKHNTEVSHLIKQLATTNASSVLISEQTDRRENMSRTASLAKTEPRQSIRLDNKASQPPGPDCTYKFAATLANSSAAAGHSSPATGHGSGHLEKSESVLEMNTGQDPITGEEQPSHISESPVDLPAETPPLAVKPELPNNSSTAKPDNCSVTNVIPELGSSGHERAAAPRSADSDPMGVAGTNTKTVTQIKSISETHSSESSVAKTGLKPPFETLLVKPRIQSLTPFRNSKTNSGSSLVPPNGHLSHRQWIVPGAADGFQIDSAGSGAPIKDNNNISATDEQSHHEHSESFSNYDDHLEASGVALQNERDRSSPGFSPPRSYTAAAGSPRHTTSLHPDVFASSPQTTITLKMPKASSKTEENTDGLEHKAVRVEGDMGTADEKESSLNEWLLNNQGVSQRPIAVATKNNVSEFITDSLQNTDAVLVEKSNATFPDQDCNTSTEDKAEYGIKSSGTNSIDKNDESNLQVISTKSINEKEVFHILSIYSH
ncbi:unnamed protein product [Gongylonema pulchrum]|uniref:BRCT domain-containing protein n=1 Tax=Gongylonema pulchrum TaxID=637853 RepID=A0A183E7U7_9BILA|nr:unnamed protein product [Gongylonema pulchrum]